MNGKTIIIKQIQHELLGAFLTVYIFEVIKNHVYYGFGILVHNADYLRTAVQKPANILVGGGL